MDAFNWDFIALFLKPQAIHHCISSKLACKSDNAAVADLRRLKSAQPALPALPLPNRQLILLQFCLKRFVSVLSEGEPGQPEGGSIQLPKMRLRVCL